MKLIGASEEQDIVKELQKKFKMPLGEVLARKKREAEAKLRKRRMTLGSNNLFTKYQEVIRNASGDLKRERRGTFVNTMQRDSLTKLKFKASAIGELST